MPAMPHYVRSNGWKDWRSCSDFKTNSIASVECKIWTRHHSAWDSVWSTICALLPFVKTCPFVEVHVAFIYCCWKSLAFVCVAFFITNHVGIKSYNMKNLCTSKFEIWIEYDVHLTFFCIDKASSSNEIFHSYPILLHVHSKLWTIETDCSMWIICYYLISAFKKCIHFFHKTHYEMLFIKTK